MDPASLQVVNNYLLDKNVGQALFVLFVVTFLAVLPLRNRKITALTIGVFGAIFVLTPISASALHFRFLGFALVVVSPMLYLTAGE